MKNSTKFLLLAVILVTAFSFSSRGQTPVNGGIYANTTWTLANSPYVVTDTVVVFPGVTLTIQPGVVVKIADHKRIEIRQATLNAVGTLTDSITFTSNSTSPSPGIWADIYLNNAKITKLNYCKVKYAGIGSSVTDTVIIKNSYFCNSLYSGVIIDYNATMFAQVDNCLFRNNKYGVTTTGFIFVQGNIMIYNCKFYGNENGIYSTGGRTTINNCIVKNNIIGMDVTGTNDISYCTITNNQTGIGNDNMFLSTLDVKISNCIIDSNVLTGCDLTTCNSAVLLQNEIKYNGTGILHNNYYGSIRKNIIENNNIGIKVNMIGDTISCNSFCNNTSYDIYYMLSYDVDYSNNYWCTSDSGIIESRIFDGYDNINYGLVHYMPVDASQCYMNPQCSAYFSFYPDAIVPHQYYAVNFSTGVQPLTYQWNWGDGTVFTTQAYPTHTYYLPGNYIICLTIADALGCTQTYCNPPTYLFKSENSIVQVNVIAPGSIGIADNEKKNTFCIFPNPATDYVTLQLAEDISNATIKVYNLLGELKSTNNTSQAKTDIDISKLAAGVYIIEVVTDKSSYRQKFIKE